MGRKPKSAYVETSEDDILLEARNFSIPASEQETNINFSRLDCFATICTSDTTMKTKYDKLCENSPYYSVVSDDGYYKTYRVSDKSLISCRSKKREMSEEAKAAASQRFKELHAEGRIGRKKKPDIAVDDKG